MPHVVDTNRLVLDGVIGRKEADEIARRSRETMVALTVNTVLCAGIIAATLGLVFWLADALAVAIAGGIFLAVGLSVLVRGSELYRMLGNAAALIGAGMLIAGSGVELLQTYQPIADMVMLIAGAAIAGLAWLGFARGDAKLRFATGAILLMGVAFHLTGLALAFEHLDGWGQAVVFGYASMLIAVAGYLVDVRVVTALAIVPFAQMLDTGTSYFHAAYVFYSPESTLTILQMTALIGACVWVSTKSGDRLGRHAGILAILAAVVGNLAFLVGSLWGDNVGASLFDYPAYDPELTWQERRAEIEAFEAQFFHVSEHVFTVVWAILLAVGAFWAAHVNRRGLFNASIVFGGIHGYTQVFETLGDEPLAWALGGLAAIPLAWGMWRLNLHLALRQVQAT
ncbi:MAG: hypothetical protein HKN18_07345 [Silicimonas sp.]|nr:hypothetical protein [Silicimonas sp.]